MKCCIVGLGVFGRNLALRLAQLGAEVLAIDRREENVTAIKDDVAAALTLDFGDPTPLERLPIAEMDVVVIAIGDDFEASLAFTVKAQELGAKRLVCRVLSPMHRRLLELLKVERMVVPEEVAARGLAHSLSMRGVVETFDLGDGHAIIEAAVPAGLAHRSIATAAEAFRRAGVRLVTIKRVDRGLLARWRGGPGAAPPRHTLGVVALDEPFAPDDIFVLFGPEKGLRQFLEDNAASR
jgi:trk system potassium uptake protein TrkA